MATSKTLAPTNVTISIPAMTDQPDASVFSNCVDKEADAINALNSNKQNKVQTANVSGTTDSTGDINVQLSANSYIPVAFKVTGGNMPTTAPRMFFQTSQGTGWFIKFINDSTLANIANTTVEGILYYLAI